MRLFFASQPGKDLGRILLSHTDDARDGRALPGLSTFGDAQRVAQERRLSLERLS
jgi:hypothetical protein